MKLKGLKRYHVGGVYYVYHRDSGKRLPAHLPEDHPDFLDAYFDAVHGKREKPSENEVTRNSIEDLSRRYLASHEFAALSKNYQDVRRRDLNRLRRQNDGAVARLQIHQIRSAHIIADMDKLAPNPANERRKTWSALCAFAVSRQIIQSDPVKTVSKVATPKSGGHVPWTFEEIAKFRAYWPHGTKQRLAFEICYWFGCRISDAVNLGDGNLTHDGWFAFKQQKTGGEVFVPFNRRLPEFAVPADLDQLKLSLAARNRRPGSTYLETQEGKPRSAKGATGWFADAARAAGLPAGKTAHGLRKSRMIQHAENGATTKQIGAWSGHASLKEIEHYTRDADKKRILTPSALETGKFY
jgi:integrase